VSRKKDLRDKLLKTLDSTIEESIHLFILETPALAKKFPGEKIPLDLPEKVKVNKEKIKTICDVLLEIISDSSTYSNST